MGSFGERALSIGWNNGDNATSSFAGLTSDIQTTIPAIPAIPRRKGPTSFKISSKSFHVNPEDKFVNLINNKASVSSLAINVSSQTSKDLCERNRKLQDSYNRFYKLNKNDVNQVGLDDYYTCQINLRGKEKNKFDKDSKKENKSKSHYGLNSILSNYLCAYLSKQFDQNSAETTSIEKSVSKEQNSNTGVDKSLLTDDMKEKKNQVKDEILKITAPVNKNVDKKISSNITITKTKNHHQPSLESNALKSFSTSVIHQSPYDRWMISSGKSDEVSLLNRSYNNVRRCPKKKIEEMLNIHHHLPRTAVMAYRAHDHASECASVPVRNSLSTFSSMTQWDEERYPKYMGYIGNRAKQITKPESGDSKICAPVVKSSTLCEIVEKGLKRPDVKLTSIRKSYKKPGSSITSHDFHEEKRKRLNVLTANQNDKPTTLDKINLKNRPVQNCASLCLVGQTKRNSVNNSLSLPTQHEKIDGNSGDHQVVKSAHVNNKQHNILKPRARLVAQNAENNKTNMAECKTGNTKSLTSVCRSFFDNKSLSFAQSSSNLDQKKNKPKHYAFTNEASDFCLDNEERHVICGYNNNKRKSKLSSVSEHIGLAHPPKVSERFSNKFQALNKNTHSFSSAHLNSNQNASSGEKVCDSMLEENVSPTRKSSYSNRFANLISSAVPRSLKILSQFPQRRPTIPKESGDETKQEVKETKHPDGSLVLSSQENQEKQPDTKKKTTDKNWQTSNHSQSLSNQKVSSSVKKKQASKEKRGSTSEVQQSSNDKTASSSIYDKSRSSQKHSHLPKKMSKSFSEKEISTNERRNASNEKVKEKLSVYADKKPRSSKGKPTLHNEFQTSSLQDTQTAEVKKPQKRSRIDEIKKIHQADIPDVAMGSRRNLKIRKSASTPNPASDDHQTQADFKEGDEELKNSMKQQNVKSKSKEEKWKDVNKIDGTLRKKLREEKENLKRERILKEGMIKNPTLNSGPVKDEVREKIKARSKFKDAAAVNEKHHSKTTVAKKLSKDELNAQTMLKKSFGKKDLFYEADMVSQGRNQLRNKHVQNETKNKHKNADDSKPPVSSKTQKQDSYAWQENKIITQQKRETKEIGDTGTVKEKSILEGLLDKSVLDGLKDEKSYDHESDKSEKKEDSSYGSEYLNNPTPGTVEKYPESSPRNEEDGNKDWNLVDAFQKLTDVIVSMSPKKGTTHHEPAEKIGDVALESSKSNTSYSFTDSNSDSESASDNSESPCVASSQQSFSSFSEASKKPAIISPPINALSRNTKPEKKMSDPSLVVAPSIPKNYLSKEKLNQSSSHKSYASDSDDDTSHLDSTADVLNALLNQSQYNSPKKKTFCSYKPSPNQTFQAMNEISKRSEVARQMYLETLEGDGRAADLPKLSFSRNNLASPEHMSFSVECGKGQSTFQSPQKTFIETGELRKLPAPKSQRTMPDKTFIGNVIDRAGGRSSSPTTRRLSLAQSIQEMVEDNNLVSPPMPASQVQLEDENNSQLRSSSPSETTPSTPSTITSTKTTITTTTTTTTTSAPLPHVQDDHTATAAAATETCTTTNALAGDDVKVALDACEALVFEETSGERREEMRRELELLVIDTVIEEREKSDQKNKIEVFAGKEKEDLEIKTNEQDGPQETKLLRDNTLNQRHVECTGLIDDIDDSITSDLSPDCCCHDDDDADTADAGGYVESDVYSRMAELGRSFGATISSAISSAVGAVQNADVREAEVTGSDGLKDSTKVEKTSESPVNS